MIERSARWLIAALACVPVIALAAASESASASASSGSASGAAHSASLPRGSVHAATLDVESAATSVVIGVGPHDASLLTASTPAAAGEVPALAKGASGVVHLRLRSTGGGDGAAAVKILLSPAVVWTIHLDGGAKSEHLDLRRASLAALVLRAGVSHASVLPPSRHGTLVIREVGGASTLTVSVPAAVAVKVRVGGGAGGVRVFGHRYGGVGVGTVIVGPKYASTARRTYLDLVGGVSSLVVRHA